MESAKTKYDHKETEEGGEGVPKPPDISEKVHVDERLEVVQAGKRPVPDGGWGWFVVLGSTLAQILLGGLEKSRGVIYNEFLDRFGSGSAVTAWVVSMTGLLRLCGGPVASILADKFGIRPVVIAGGLICAISYIINGFITSIIGMLFTYGILGGIGQMCAYAPSVIIVGLYFDKRRSLAAGLSSAGIGFGTFIVPPVVELLLEAVGFTGTFFIMAGLGLNLCVSGALFRPLDLHWKIVDLARKRKTRSAGVEAVALNSDADVAVEALREKSSRDEASALSATNMPVEVVLVDNNGSPSLPQTDIILPQKRRKRGLCAKLPCFNKKKGDESLVENDQKKKVKYFDFSLLKDFPFLSFCVTLLLWTMAVQIGHVFIFKFARERGVSNTNAALLLSIMGGCDTVGRVGSGIVFDRPNIKPHRQYIYNIFLFAISGTSCMFPLAYSFPAFAGISAAFGFFCGTYIAQKSVIIVDLVGVDKLVYSFGMIISFQGIGFLLGPTLSGVMIDHFKRYDYSFYLAGVVTFLAGLVFLSGNIVSYRRKQRDANGSQ